MQRALKVTIFIFLCSIFLLPAPGRASGSKKELRLGANKVEITPEAGTPLAGFGRRHGRPSTGIHDPLFARAIAVEKGGQPFIFISCDLVLIDAGLRKRVLEKIREKIPLPEENLVLAATHTHSGAGAIGSRFWERFIMGKFRRSVFEKITSDIAEAAIRAAGQTFPVSVEYGEISIALLTENRISDKPGQTERLKVLRFKNPEGNIQAHLILMAAHPTLLPAKNMRFSADFPGVLNQIIEEKNPGSVSLFLNGAAGDLRPKLNDLPAKEPRNELEEKFDRVTAYSRALAAKMEEISFSMLDPDGPWKAALLKKKLPPVKARAGWFRFPSVIGGRVFPRHSFFQAVRLGPLLFLAFPAELSSETGHEIEKLATARKFKPFVLGYANDYMGYVIPERYYPDLEQYESRASFYGPKLDWFVQKQALVLMDHLIADNERAVLFPKGRLEPKQGLPVLHLEGDPYHLGFEEGRLLKNEIHQGLDDIFRYFRKELPVPVVNRAGIYWLLDRAWKKMEPHITYSEFLQMKGLADGSGIPFKKIRRLHSLPELYPTLCANGAYWGKATVDSRLIAIRNLDWNRKMGIQKYAAVKFIREPGQPRYVNIGYSGFTGVLSGMNEKGISVGQIGSTSADETLSGVPMPFLLKRILEESASLEDAAALFKRSDLTQGYNYVIADATARRAMAVEATRRHLAFFYDQDPAESKVPYAFPLQNAVFRADTAIDPVIRNLQKASKGNPEKPGLEPPAGSAYEIRYKKQAELVKNAYGKITPETAKEIAREIAPGSNIQSVIYAFPEFWVANAQGEKKAAESDYIEFNFPSHFDEQSEEKSHG